MKLHRSAALGGASLLALFCAWSATALVALPAVAADATPVLRATLPNGLRVIIVRNTLAPVVATSVNYLVGSDEAPPGFPGTAHAQEHMMFRGSPGLSADQLADIGSVMGGNFNANTRESLTQYIFTVPAEDLDVALHIEAIRMQDVFDARQDWDHERGAIEQEVAQDLSNPWSAIWIPPLRSRRSVNCSAPSPPRRCPRGLWSDCAPSTRAHCRWTPTGQRARRCWQCGCRVCTVRTSRRWRCCPTF